MSKAVVEKIVDEAVARLAHGEAVPFRVPMDGASPAFVVEAVTARLMAWRRDPRYQGLNLDVTAKHIENSDRAREWNWKFVEFTFGPARE